MHSISSILARYFMNEIHGICLKSMRENEAKLLDYLICGRGSCLLHTLDIIGAQVSMM